MNYGRRGPSCRGAGYDNMNKGSHHQPAAEALEPRTLFTSPPPTVLEAFVGGSHWTQPFKDYLADNVQGASAEHGLSLNHTYAQGILPWVNLDRITLKVNARLVVDQGDLTVRGANVAQYPVVGFEYSFDPHAYRATVTWILGRPLGNDRLLVRLDVDSPTGVRTGDFGDEKIDGDGDYQIGGDFVRRVDALPGGFGGSGPLTFRSVEYLRSMLGTSTTEVGSGRYAYAEWGDVDGSGRINVIDLAHVRYRLGDRLPPSQPSAAASPVDAATSPFGTTPIRIRPAARGILAGT